VGEFLSRGGFAMPMRNNKVLTVADCQKLLCAPLSRQNDSPLKKQKKQNKSPHIKPHAQQSVELAFPHQFLSFNEVHFVLLAMKACRGSLSACLACVRHKKKKKNVRQKLKQHWARYLAQKKMLTGCLALLHRRLKTEPSGYQKQARDWMLALDVAGDVPGLFSKIAEKEKKILKATDSKGGIFFWRQKIKATWVDRAFRKKVDALKKREISQNQQPSKEKTFSDRQYSRARKALRNVDKISFPRADPLSGFFYQFGRKKVFDYVGPFSTGVKARLSSLERQLGYDKPLVGFKKVKRFFGNLWEHRLTSMLLYSKLKKLSARMKKNEQEDKNMLAKAQHEIAKKLMTSFDVEKNVHAGDYLQNCFSLYKKHEQKAFVGAVESCVKRQVLAVVDKQYNNASNQRQYLLDNLDRFVKLDEFGDRKFMPTIFEYQIERVNFCLQAKNNRLAFLGAVKQHGGDVARQLWTTKMKGQVGAVVSSADPQVLAQFIAADKVLHGGQAADKSFHLGQSELFSAHLTGKIKVLNLTDQASSQKLFGLVEGYGSDINKKDLLTQIKRKIKAKMSFDQIVGLNDLIDVACLGSANKGPILNYVFSELTSLLSAVKTLDDANAVFAALQLFFKKHKNFQQSLLQPTIETLFSGLFSLNALSVTDKPRINALEAYAKQADKTNDYFAQVIRGQLDGLCAEIESGFRARPVDQNILLHNVLNDRLTRALAHNQITVQAYFAINDAIYEDSNHPDWNKIETWASLFAKQNKQLKLVKFACVSEEARNLLKHHGLAMDFGAIYKNMQAKVKEWITANNLEKLTEFQGIFTRFFGAAAIAEQAFTLVKQAYGKQNWDGLTRYWTILDQYYGQQKPKSVTTWMMVVAKKCIEKNEFLVGKKNYGLVKFVYQFAGEALKVALIAKIKEKQAEFNKLANDDLRTVIALPYVLESTGLKASFVDMLTQQIQSIFQDGLKDSDKCIDQLFVCLVVLKEKNTEDFNQVKQGLLDALQPCINTLKTIENKNSRAMLRLVLTRVNDAGLSSIATKISELCKTAGVDEGFNQGEQWRSKIADWLKNNDFEALTKNSQMVRRFVEYNPVQNALEKFPSEFAAFSGNTTALLTKLATYICNEDADYTSRKADLITGITTAIQKSTKTSGDQLLQQIPFLLTLEKAGIDLGVTTIFQKSITACSDEKKLFWFKKGAFIADLCEDDFLIALLPKLVNQALRENTAQQRQAVFKSLFQAEIFPKTEKTAMVRTLYNEMLTQPKKETEIFNNGLLLIVAVNSAGKNQSKRVSLGNCEIPLGARPGMVEAITDYLNQKPWQQLPYLFAICQSIPALPTLAIWDHRLNAVKALNKENTELFKYFTSFIAVFIAHFRANGGKIGAQKGLSVQLKTSFITASHWDVVWKKHKGEMKAELIRVLSSFSGKVDLMAKKIPLFLEGGQDFVVLFRCMIKILEAKPFFERLFGRIAQTIIERIANIKKNQKDDLPEKGEGLSEQEMQAHIKAIQKPVQQFLFFCQKLSLDKAKKSMKTALMVHFGALNKPRLVQYILSLLPSLDLFSENEFIALGQQQKTALDTRDAISDISNVFTVALKRFHDSTITWPEAVNTIVDKINRLLPDNANGLLGNLLNQVSVQDQNITIKQMLLADVMLQGKGGKALLCVASKEEWIPFVAVIQSWFDLYDSKKTAPQKKKQYAGMLLEVVETRLGSMQKNSEIDGEKDAVLIGQAATCYAVEFDLAKNNEDSSKQGQNAGGRLVGLKMLYDALLASGLTSTQKNNFVVAVNVECNLNYTKDDSFLAAIKQFSAERREERARTPIKTSKQDRVTQLRRQSGPNSAPGGKNRKGGSSSKPSPHSAKARFFNVARFLVSALQDDNTSNKTSSSHATQRKKPNSSTGRQKKRHGRRSGGNLSVFKTGDGVARALKYTPKSKIK
jgi:hypothetical protein